MTSARASGSRCARTNADDSVNELPMPTSVCLIASGSISITVPVATPSVNDTFSLAESLSPASLVTRISELVVSP